MLEPLLKNLPFLSNPHVLIPFQLTSGEVHSWCVNLDVSPEAYARLRTNLSGSEHHRSARFQFECDRRRFVVAHGVLRELLARYLQTQPDRICYVHNAFGKPDLSPEFGSRLRFNLSHSAGLALIAIATDSDVGIDLEFIQARPYVEIAEHFFSAAEVDHLKGLPNHRRGQAFFRCWTRTEAYVKACGLGLASSDGVPNVIDPAGHWSFFTLQPAAGFIGTLAIEGSGWRLAQWRWQMSIDAPLEDSVSPPVALPEPSCFDFV